MFLDLFSIKVWAFLFQVAVIAYLAHTGSFVPAKKAVIGVLDQIHTRIQTTESAASQLSAFLIDLRQVWKQSPILPFEDKIRCFILF